jgi:hypothetical protein
MLAAIETGSDCGLAAVTANRTLSPGTAASSGGADTVRRAGDVSNDNTEDLPFPGAPAVMTTVSLCEGAAATALKLAVVSFAPISKAAGTLRFELLDVKAILC